jgi:hypothetical protein
LLMMLLHPIFRKPEIQSHNFEFPK